MTRILVFLSTFIIVVGLAAVLYVFSGGDVNNLRPADAEVEVATATVDAEALLEEATDYFLGEGVEQSDEKGAALVQAAADAGNQRAIGLLGTLYMGGIGVEQDFDKATEWLALSNDMEGQELAANLMAFDNIMKKLPPEEKEKQLAAAKTSAHEQVRVSFIAALRDLRSKKDADVMMNEVTTEESITVDGAEPAVEENSDDSEGAVAVPPTAEEDTMEDTAEEPVETEETIPAAE